MKLLWLRWYVSNIFYLLIFLIFLTGNRDLFTPEFLNESLSNETLLTKVTVDFSNDFPKEERAWRETSFCVNKLQILWNHKIYS